MTPNELTDEQVENWRRILLGAIGPYAQLMTRAEVQAYRDRMQAIADKLPDDEQKAETK